MILEHALLTVRPGHETAFEAAMQAAISLIAASPGFGGIEIHPAAERSGRYLLLVRWDAVASHRDGFRQSDRYAAWRAALHHFYDPMPDVVYFGDSIIDSPDSAR